MDSFAIFLLENLGFKLWGFKPNLMKNIVERLGGFRSLVWFVANMPRYERTLKMWGPIRTHLLVTEISALQGCPYCTFGHLYALQLHYFKQSGKVIAGDNNSILYLHRVDQDTAIGILNALIDSIGIPEEHKIFERMLLLRNGKQVPSQPEDGRILHLLKMFRVLNTCGIQGGTPLDEAHDPINKDHELKKRFETMRLEGQG
jgi:hypothetical protein